MMSGFRSTCCFLLIALGGVASRPVATAQPARADQQINFDIPAQSLDTALTQYFRLTGVQLLYDSAVTARRRSSAVRGAYAPREALRRILAGSGLVARYSRSSAAIIAPAGGQSAGPLVPLGRVVVREAVSATQLSPIDRIAYYNLIEQELQTRLRTDERTARLIFQIVVAVRVQDNGRLRDVRVRQSSGRRAADGIIAEVLESYAVTRPPAGLPQPLLVSLLGRRD